MKQSTKEKYLKADAGNLNIDVEEFLINKGIEFTYNGDWLRMQCPFPEHNDNNPSFFIHKEHLSFNCFVCGGGNWEEFLERMGWENEEVDDITINQLSSSKWKNFKCYINKKNDKEESFSVPNGFSLISDNRIACRNHLEYLRERNIANLIDTFKIGYTSRRDELLRSDGKLLYGSVYKNRIIIPCHNEIGKLIWFEGRYIGGKKISNKYWRPKGVDKTKYLFNFHRVKKKGYNWVILVEGIIDAMMLWQWGFPAVCCFGSRVSDEQIALLMEFNKVYVALDNDEAGIKGWVKLKRTIAVTGIEVMRILFPRDKDVNDISKEEFLKRYYRAKLA